MKQLTKIWAVLLLLIPLSCTNLEIKPNRGLYANVIFKEPKNHFAYLMKIYTSFTLTGQRQPAGESDLDGSVDEGFSSFVRAYWKHQELSSDEALNSWADLGLVDFQNHSWADNNQFTKALWYRMYFIITYSNDLIFQGSDASLDTYGVTGADRATIKAYRAEAQFLRAMAYWIALDLFRNVPLYTEISTEGKGNAKPEEIFAQIESDLKAAEVDLPDAKANEYGRANKTCAQMLLAKLYLNAEVYIKQPKYTEALTELNKVINSGYTLATKYENLFLADNDKESTTEIIFPLPLDGNNAQTWGGTTFLVAASLADPTMQDNLRPNGTPFPSEFLTLFGTGQAWSGNRPNEALVNRFSGNTIPAADTVDPRGLFWKEGRISPEITDPKIFGTNKDGYLCIKWRNITSQGLPGKNNTFSDVDFPLLRLGDAYLMYAECVVRGGAGGDVGTAVNLINQLRERAYGDDRANITSGNLTEDFILDERQREMYWEGTRRTDLVRFGKFSNSVWPWKGGIKDGKTSEEFRNIFPIPAAELTSNPKIKQNPGY